MAASGLVTPDLDRGKEGGVDCGGSGDCGLGLGRPGDKGVRVRAQLGRPGC